MWYFRVLVFWNFFINYNTSNNFCIGPNVLLGIILEPLSDFIFIILNPGTFFTMSIKFTFASSWCSTNSFLSWSRSFLQERTGISGKSFQESAAHPTPTNTSVFFIFRIIPWPWSSAEKGQNNSLRFLRLITSSWSMGFHNTVRLGGKNISGMSPKIRIAFLGRFLDFKSCATDGANTVWNHSWKMAPLIQAFVWSRYQTVQSYFCRLLNPQLLHWQFLHYAVSLMRPTFAP